MEETISFYVERESLMHNWIINDKRSSPMDKQSTTVPYVFGGSPVQKPSGIMNKKETRLLKPGLFS